MGHPRTIPNHHNFSPIASKNPEHLQKSPKLIKKHLQKIWMENLSKNLQQIPRKSQENLPPVPGASTPTSTSNERLALLCALSAVGFDLRQVDLPEAEKPW